VDVSEKVLRVFRIAAARFARSRKLPSAVRAVCGPLRAPLMVLERGTMSIGE